MPVYQYEGLHYDLPDGLSDEQAVGKIKSHLGQSGAPTERSMYEDRQKQILPDLAKNLMGIGQAGMDIVGGIPGFLAGLGTGIGTAVVHGDPSGGLDLAKEVMGKATPSNALGLPTDNGGYQMAMKPLEWFNEALGFSAKGYGEIAKALGASEDAIKGVSSAAELALLAGSTGIGAKTKVGFDFKKKAEAPKVTAPEVKPIDKVAAAMEAQMAAKEAPVTGPDMRGQDIAGYDQVMREPGSINPYDVGGFVSEAKRGNETVVDPVAQRGLFDTEVKPEDGAYMDQVRSDTEAGIKQQEAQKVLDARQADLERGVQQARVQDEAITDTAHRKLPPADEVTSRTERPIGMRGFANKQTGAIQLPFGKKKAVGQIEKIPAFKEAIKNFIPEQEPIPDVIKRIAESDAKDLDQNAVQKGFNYLTKGSLFMAEKTNNPVLKVTGDKIREAQNLALADIGRVVHDGLAPIAQSLSMAEKVAVHGIQALAEKKGFELTPEFLREHGMNDKQIAWVTEQQKMMSELAPKIDKVMELTGKAPINRRVSNLASMMDGDFRRLVYVLDENGKSVINGKKASVVGALGADTKLGLGAQLKRLQKENPAYIIGEKKYYGGRNHQAADAGFKEILQILNESEDPLHAKFADDVEAMLTKDSFDYMNAKSHTMEKKGIFGMSGRATEVIGKRGTALAEENTKRMFKAQIQYAETTLQWVHLAEAVHDLKPLLKEDNGINMPIAKKMAKEYVDGALGNAPGKLGHMVDKLGATIGDVTGLGTSIPKHILSVNKQLINSLLLGWVKLPFILGNAIQPGRNMLSMASFLKGRGAEAGGAFGLARGVDTLWKEHLTPDKLKPYEKDALKFAKDNHVYSSNLFESGNRISKDMGYWWNKGTQFAVAPLEGGTRKLTYLAYTHILHESGLRGKELYGAAQNLCITCRSQPVVVEDQTKCE